MAKKIFSLVTLLLAFSSFAMEHRGGYFKYAVLQELEKKGKIALCSTDCNSQLPRCPSATEKDKTITCFLHNAGWRCPNPEKPIFDSYSKGLGIQNGHVTRSKSYKVSIGYYQIKDYWEN